MSETKTQEEWMEEFKQLAEKHSEALARPFKEFFADKILLTRKEVREARNNQDQADCHRFLDYELYTCERYWRNMPTRVLPAYCRLCKKLTDASQGDSEGKGGEDEGISEA